MTDLSRFGIREVVGTGGADSFTGRAETAFFGIGGGDTFRAVETRPIFLGFQERQIFLGGSGADTYVVPAGTTALIADGFGSSGDTLSTTGIGFNSESVVTAEIDGRHLIVADLDTATIVGVLDWLDPARRIETIRLADGTFRFGPDINAQVVRSSDAYAGNFTFEEIGRELGVGPGVLDLSRQSLNALLQRAAELEQGPAGPIVGTAGNDVLTGTSGSDTIQGRAGADRISGLAGADRLFGEVGNDVLVGGPGGDRLDGGPGRDTASYAGSTAGVTVRLANGGASGGHAAGDTLISIEAVNGSAFRDVLIGGSRSDRLDGGGGNDLLTGGAGSDVLRGGPGNDVLDGGPGADGLFGGPGRDTFRVTEATGAVDRINDLQLGRGGDVVRLVDLLEGFSGDPADLAEFVRLRPAGAGSVVQVDTDGGGDGFVSVAALAGVSGVTADDLLGDGNLVV